MRAALSLIAIVVCTAACSGAARSPTTAPATRPGLPDPADYTTAGTGGQHDFDYFAGGWTTLQRRLKVRGAGSDDWEEFPATLCMSLYLGDLATVDELYFPTKGGPA